MRIRRLVTVPWKPLTRAAVVVSCALGICIASAPAEPGSAARQKSGLRPHREPERVVRAEARIEQRMNDPIAVDVQQLPLRDTLEFLDAVQGLQLQYDLGSLPQEEARRVMDLPITLNVKNVPLRTIFNLLLEPVRFDWIIKDGAIVVTTTAKADEQLSDWKYDVSDLAAAGIPTKELGAAIVALITPAAWATSGGKGTLNAEPEALVVRQVRPVREEAQRLLSDIRRQLTETESERRAREAGQIRKQYDVADFIDPEMPSPETLIKFVTEQVFRATWEQFGGRGTAELEGGTLTITNAAWVHERLDQLLEHVRELGLERGRSGSTFDFRAALEHVGHTVYPRSALNAALRQSVSMKFQGETLADALRRIRETYGIFCYIPDIETGKAAQTDKMRVTKTTRGLSLKGVLDELFTPFQLDWYPTVYGSVNAIPAEEAAARRDLRVFRIQELAEAGRPAAQLVEEISATIEPASWQAAGGTATIRTLPGLLLVRHNRRTHDRIQEFLDGSGKKP